MMWSIPELIREMRDDAKSLTSDGEHKTQRRHKRMEELSKGCSEEQKKILRERYGIKI